MTGLRQLLRLPVQVRVAAAGLVILIGLSLVGLPPAWLWAGAAVVVGLYVAAWVARVLLLIDGRIIAAVGASRSWSVHVKFFPSYKHVDIFRAAEGYAASRKGAVGIQSEHHMMLSPLIRGVGDWGDRRLQTPTMVSQKVGPGEEAFFPSDSFWLLPASEALGAAVVRVQYFRSQRRILLEVAAAERETAEQTVTAITDLATAQSIYRNQTIRVIFSAETPDSYGEEERDAPMDLVFVQDQTVTEEDIVLDEEVRGLLERTVVDFHRRRQTLMGLGLPGRRGVLFYGPPGTGKTHTCRHLMHRLKPITTIVVTGHALLHMKAVCAVARAFQPALVLLEDVDLVFSERQTNFYTTVLGEFLDQLDGFAPSDAVIFILTTNALERVEAAIKDRPGRVSQVVYFGRPGPELRRRYLETLLRGYDTSGLDLGRVVALTDGVSQAFLKELVIRSVQLASADGGGGRVPITHDHVERALSDMISGGGKAGKRIIGFQVEV